MFRGNHEAVVIGLKNQATNETHSTCTVGFFLDIFRKEVL